MTDEPAASSDLSQPAPADESAPAPAPAPDHTADVTTDPTPTAAMSSAPPLAPVASAAAMPVASTPVPPQPAVAWQAPPPAVLVKGQRTGLAMGAGILLVLGGIGGIILGLFIAIVGGSVASTFDFSRFTNMPDLNGANPGAIAGGAVAFVGAVIVAYSIAYLMAGIGVLRSSNWGRVLGIVVGILSGLVWLSGVTNSGRVENAGSGVLFSLVAFAIHAYIVVVLLFFWRNRPTTA